MSFEIALGTLGKALDQLSTMKVPLHNGKTKVAKAPVAVAPAPKPAVVKAAPVKAAPAKTAPKGGAKAPKLAAPVKPATKVAKAAKPADANVSSVAAGRRAVASGERPKLVDAMWIAMGDDPMNSAQVIEALEAKGWMPNASKPQGYISFMLSKNADMFERVERGVYKRVEGAGPEGYADSKKGKKATVKAAPVAAATAKAPKKLAAKGAPSGKAVRVASTPQAEETVETAQADASTDSSAASDPPASVDTDSTLSGLGLSTNEDEPVANPFAD